jgi:hypothetical protein
MSKEVWDFRKDTLGCNFSNNLSYDLSLSGLFIWEWCIPYQEYGNANKGPCDILGQVWEEGL